MSKTTAEIIKELRKQRGMTLEDVAQKVGVGKSTVRKWETGMIENMGKDKIISLAKALNTSPKYLMGWEDDKKRSTFKERLKEALELKNMTSAELSRLTGIDEGAISNYRKGKYEPKQIKTEIIAKALNVSIPWLIGLDVQMNEKLEKLPSDLSDPKRDLIDKIINMDENSIEKLSKIIQAFQDIQGI